MRVREEEHHLLVLSADARVQRLEVLAERGFVVPARERDLEDAAPGGERRQLGERLLSRAPHPDEERVALVETHDPVYAREVLERVLEEHQVHRLVLGVVQAEELLEHGLDVGVRREVLVRAVRRGLLGAFFRQAHFFRGVLVVAEQDGVREHRRGVELVLLVHEFGELLDDNLLVLRGDQAVVQNAQRLVAPQPDEARARLELLLARAQQALVDARQVS